MKERIAIWFAYRLPKRVAYWTFIRLSCGDGQGKPYPGHPGERTTMDVLRCHHTWSR